MPLSLPPSAVSYPDWLSELVPWTEILKDSGARMALVHKLALANVEHGGGPFAALVCTASGQVVSVGTNRVVPNADSTAHAEIVAIRNAQQECATHDLSARGLPALELYASCSPCIQCFGAVWWSGIKAVYASAAKEDAESVGFDEGPVSPELWAEMKRHRGVAYVPNVSCGEEAHLPFKLFAKSGVMY